MDSLANWLAAPGLGRHCQIDYDRLLRCYFVLLSSLDGAHAEANAPTLDAAIATAIKEISQ